LEITVEDKTCWICGRHVGLAGPMTSHHTLPKHLKPKKNFICPVCHDCHEDLNRNDSKGLVKFAYKIERSTKELSGMVKRMTSNLIKKGNK